MNNHDRHSGCSHEQPEHDSVGGTDGAPCCGPDQVGDAGPTAAHRCCGEAADRPAR